MAAFRLNIGLDIGKVITDGRRDDPEDTSFFGDNFLKTPMVDDTLDSVHRIIQHFGKKRTFVISRCGAKTAGKSMWWLDSKGFFAPDMLDIRNVRFCRERQDKAPIAAELGLDFFIDDKADVLLPMQTVGTRILFGPQSQRPPSSLYYAETWGDALKILGI